ncbi:hypothetical protein CHU95_06240 [Niveispirillum lacus]|uniref:Uncharacterized protein n=1 Tax=Niveispirillum lacus TaxID=1981099 RepID=A0A255Z4Q4_9PROT|nr:hypothetical protein CHU95_06240 [Niveispirillum lacus]
MPPSDALSGPDALIFLDDLHTRYDGRPPRQQRLAALVAGNDVLELMADQALQQRLQDQVAAARLGVSRRRGHLPADRVMEDPWLVRLTGALEDARNAMQAPQGKGRPMSKALPVRC